MLVKTYGTIFGLMNIHLLAILMFTKGLRLVLTQFAISEQFSVVNFQIFQIFQVSIPAISETWHCYALYLYTLYYILYIYILYYTYCSFLRVDHVDQIAKGSDELCISEPEVFAQGQLREMEATMRQEVEKAVAAICGSWQWGLSVMIRQQT